MEYNACVLSLGYILSEDKKEVLMLFYKSNPNDFSYGKYNGYSDFLREDESALEAFERVIKEMTGLTPIKSEFRGSIHWPNFKKNDKSFFAQIFVCYEFEGDIILENMQGENRWVGIEELLRGDIPIWEGDKYFLPLVFDNYSKPFHGYMPYENGTPKTWSYKRS